MFLKQTGNALGYGIAGNALYAALLHWLSLLNYNRVWPHHGDVSREEAQAMRDDPEGSFDRIADRLDENLEVGWIVDRFRKELIEALEKENPPA